MLVKQNQTPRILSIDHEAMEVELEDCRWTNDSHLYDEACNDYNLPEKTAPR